MKVILADDERLALEVMERMIREIDSFEVIGKYTNPHLALEAIFRDVPDVVFLDIEMPEITGIELAERIRSRLPATKVVFVTAYDSYAVKAFELSAIDYLLKPVKRERLAETAKRLLEKAEKELIHTEDRPVIIRCFQVLQIELPAHRTEQASIRWRTSKAQELFAFLVHQRGQLVRKDTLLDILWPESDWKKGYTLLYTAVYQIRKMLENAGVHMRILSYDEGYQLEMNQAKLDVAEWEQGIREAPPLSAATLPEHLSLLELYRGDYMADNAYIWAESERQRLRVLWIQHAMTVGEHFMAVRNYAEAISLHLRIQSLYPYMEQTYFILMQLYEAAGDRSSVERQHTRLEEMLSGEYGTKPQEAVRLWYEKWRSHS